MYNSRRKNSKVKHTENIAKELIRFSLPLILSGVLQQLYSWADAFIVGNVEGELALAAIGVTATVTNFFLSAITGFTVGLAVLFAQKFGSGEKEFLSRILSTFSIILGGIFILVSAAGMHQTFQLLKLLNTTQDTIYLAEGYLKIIFAGLPFLVIYNIYSAAIRGVGDSRTPFLAVMVSSAVNIVLDLILVAGMRLGVQGAAVATVIAQAAMTVFLVVHAGKKHPVLRIHYKKKLIDQEALRQGAALGIPTMIQSSISAFGGMILQNFMNGFGTQTVAAVTTAYRIDLIILLPVFNLGTAISTLVAQNSGAGEKARAKKVLKIGTAMMTAASLMLTILVIFTGGWLISLFGVGTEAVRIGTAFFRRIAVFYIIYGLGASVRGYLEGIGDVVFSSMAGIASLMFRIAASYLLRPLAGNMVIAYAEGLSWAVLLLLLTGRMIWKMKKE